MAHTRPLSKRPSAAVSVGDLREYISLLRMFIALLMEAHEVLGIPIPRKDGG